VTPTPNIILFAGAAKEEAWFFMNEAAGASMESEHPRNRFIATPRKAVFKTAWECTSQLKRFGLAVGTHHGAARKLEKSVSQSQILYNRINILSQHHYRPWRPQIIKIFARQVKIFLTKTFR